MFPQKKRKSCGLRNVSMRTCRPEWQTPGPASLGCQQQQELNTHCVSSGALNFLALSTNVTTSVFFKQILVFKQIRFVVNIHFRSRDKFPVCLKENKEEQLLMETARVKDLEENQKFSFIVYYCFDVVVVCWNTYDLRKTWPRQNMAMAPFTITAPSFSQAPPT